MFELKKIEKIEININQFLHCIDGIDQVIVKLRY